VIMISPVFCKNIRNLLHDIGYALPLCGSTSAKRQGLFYFCHASENVKIFGQNNVDNLITQAVQSCGVLISWP